MHTHTRAYMQFSLRKIACRTRHAIFLLSSRFFPSAFRPLVFRNESMECKITMRSSAWVPPRREEKKSIAPVERSAAYRYTYRAHARTKKIPTESHRSSRSAKTAVSVKNQLSGKKKRILTKQFCRLRCNYLSKNLNASKANSRIN